MWIFILGVVIGIAIGRAYSRMKYHYPEFRAEIDLRVARTRAQEAKYKAAETEARLAENEMYERIANS